MTIETLTPSATVALAKLMIALWPECSFTEELEAATVIAQAKNEICYLARHNDQYIAFIHLTLRHDYVEGASAAPTAYVEALYVEPEYRKQAVAKALVEQGIVWAKQQGCSELASDTGIENTASIDFHKNIGFEEVNRVVCFIRTL